MKNYNEEEDKDETYYDGSDSTRGKIVYRYGKNLFEFLFWL